MRSANRPVHIHLIPCEGAKWVALEGELHGSNLATVEKTLIALAQSGEVLVIDLGRLSVDEPGVARIFPWTAVAAGHAGGAVLLANPSSTVRQALRSLGANWLLTPE